MTFFRKTILSNPVATSKGYRVTFQPIGDDEGVIALEDQEAVAELRSMAERKVGGIIEITKEQFEELKKQVGQGSLPKQSLGDPPQWPKVRLGLDSRDDVAAAGAFKQATAPAEPEQTVLEEQQAPKPADPALNRPVPKRIINKPNVLS